MLKKVVFSSYLNLSESYLNKIAIRKHGQNSQQDIALIANVKKL